MDNYEERMKHYIYIYIYIYVYIYIHIHSIFMSMSTVDSIFGIVTFFANCLSSFESTLWNFCKPLSKFDLPKLRQGSRERKNATEEKRRKTLARILTKAHGLSRGCVGPFWTGVCNNSTMSILIMTNNSNLFLLCYIYICIAQSS